MQVRFHSCIEELPAADWESINDSRYPFLAWEFLAALERHYCVLPNYGWQPHHAALYDDTRLVNASPFYIKTNSHGEFVFDWAWADAYTRNGLNYYPKLVCAIPYTPAPGPRQLRNSNGIELIDAQIEETRRQGASSCHWLFMDAAGAEQFNDHGLLERRDVQFHWPNNDYREFGDFLGSLQRRAAKNIRRERKQIADDGLEFCWRTGAELSEEELATAFRFYALTFSRKGNLAVLNQDFFSDVARRMPEQFLVCLARHHGEPVASAVFLRDDRNLYGRYWGCERHYPFLHFETCYYQGIEYCIRHGLQSFQPGAQGEFKMRRGFSPVLTRSWHWIGDPRFRTAIRDHLQRESLLIDEYRAQLERHSPYR
jgi:predicted N-acyltransferase